MGSILLLCEKTQLSHHIVMVVQMHGKFNILAHFSSRDLKSEPLYDFVHLLALNIDLITVYLLISFIYNRLLIIGAYTDIFDKALSLFVVFGHDIFTLSVINCTILLVEENLVLNNQYVFKNSFTTVILGLFLDHSQVVENNLAKVMRALIF